MTTLIADPEFPALLAERIEEIVSRLDVSAAECHASISSRAPRELAETWFAKTEATEDEIHGLFGARVENTTHYRDGEDVFVVVSVGFQGASRYYSRDFVKKAN
jgi:hypothetical protein